MKLRLPRRRSARVAIYLLSLLLVLLAIDLILVQVRRTIRPGFETTRITSPRQADGSIDYLLALDERYGQGVTPQNNAAVLVLQALGREALPSNQPTDGITQAMGMPHLPETGDYLVTYSKYLEDHGKMEPDLHLIDPLVWPVTISPQARAWVQANEKPLKVMIAASQRSRFFIPFYGGNRPETLIEIQLPHLAKMREAHLALRTRALMRLEAGDVQGFRDDLTAMLRLGRLLSRAATLIDRLVGIGMERSTCRTARVAAVSGKLSPDQLRSIREEFAGLPELPSSSECINLGERYMGLDLMQKLARVGPARASEIITLTSQELVDFASGKANQSGFRKSIMRFVPIHYEKAMRVLNSYYDGAVVACTEDSIPQRQAALKLWDEQVMSIRSDNAIWNYLMVYWPAQMLLPALARIQSKVDSADMDDQLTVIALALASYHADQHAYPARLSELTPNYLPSIPQDRFNDKPLFYEPKDKGYRLYSVGPNGLDDGGNSDPSQQLLPASQPSGTDDIVANSP